jgi:hypothetical protein
MVKAASKWLATQSAYPCQDGTSIANSPEEVRNCFSEGTVLRFFLHCAAMSSAHINDFAKGFRRTLVLTEGDIERRFPRRAGENRKKRFQH